MARIPLKDMLRTMPGAPGAMPVSEADAEPGRLGGSPRPMDIGPVTFVMIKLENEIFSNRESGPQRILIGHPYVS